jgi:hypothetical protein
LRVLASACLAPWVCDLDILIRTIDPVERDGWLHAGFFLKLFFDRVLVGKTLGCSFVRSAAGKAQCNCQRVDVLAHGSAASGSDGAISKLHYPLVRIHPDASSISVVVLPGGSIGQGTLGARGYRLRGRTTLCIPDVCLRNVGADNKENRQRSKRDVFQHACISKKVALTASPSGFGLSKSALDASKSNRDPASPRSPR